MPVDTSAPEIVVTVTSGGTVTAGRFVRAVIASDDVQVTQAGLGEHIFGVSTQDGVDGDQVTIVRSPHRNGDVTAGGTVSVDDVVMSDTDGKAVVWDADPHATAGRAMTSGVTDDTITIDGSDASTSIGAVDIGPNVAVYMVVTGSFATADLAGTYADMTQVEGSAGWDFTDLSKMFPPPPGVYSVALKAYAGGTLDEPAEIAVRTYSGTGPEGYEAAAIAAVPVGSTNMYAASASRLLTIPDEFTSIRIQGGYSNSAPTTGGVDFRAWVHRVGNIP